MNPTDLDHSTETLTHPQSFSAYVSGVNPGFKNQPLLVCHHGAGSCGLTFTVMTRHMRGSNPSVGVVSFEMRGHGHTLNLNDSRFEDASIENLVDDFVLFLRSLLRTLNKDEDEYLPRLFLLGHSLGGSVVTRAALDPSLKDGFCLGLIGGLIVVDMVEGTAISGLASTASYVRRRPQSFASIKEALQWHMRQGHRGKLRIEALQTVVPNLIRPSSDGGYVWVTDLLSSEKHWHNWFTGLSNAFLDCKFVPRLLVLAQRDHLDRPLMVASMQGKFQCSIVRETGHSIQEDQPVALAGIIESFINRTLSLA